MPNSLDIDRLRSALAELASHDMELEEFEREVAAMLADGTVDRMEVRLELEGALASGTLEADTVRRLGFDRSASPPVHRSNTAPIGRSRAGSDTLLRPVTLSPPLEADEKPGSDTESSWVDPGLLATDANVTVGHLLGRRYLLERELGRGGMGVVYLASDQEVVGETFAIKVLKPEIRRHPDSLRMLREEVRKARALHHPNIAGVYSLNSDRSGIYMLMEYLEGKTIAALIDEEFGRGMPLMRAWPLIKDIGAALAYAHDHSVIHSDLKPTNVFVTTSAKAKLLDFGVARAARGQVDRFDPNALGALTPAYASCEMLEGRPPDQSDDVYAFALLIYEMLSGRHPFNHVGTLEARAAGLRPEPLAALSRSQNEALARALAFERPKRTPSVEGLVAGLEGAPQFGKSRSVWAAVAAGAVVLVGGAGWGAYWMIGRHDRAAKPDGIAQSAPIGDKVAPARVVPPVTPPTTPPTTPTPKVTAPMVSAPPAVPMAPSVARNAPPPPPSAVRENRVAPLPGPSPVPAPPSAKVTVPINGAAPVPSILTPTSAPAREGPKPTPAGVSAELPRPPPPIGKKLAMLVAAPGHESFVDSCPYPKAASDRGDTGEVVLLILVAADGSVVDTQVETSSGVDVLDEAAVACVKENARFLPRKLGPKQAGYWGREKFNWSFGAE